MVRVLAFIMTVVIDNQAYAQCQAPEYRRGQVFEDSASTIDLTISMPLPNFVPKTLVCLAELLKREYSNRKTISVLIFSSSYAARYWRTFQADFPQTS